MKNLLLVLLISVCIFSCEKQDPNEQIQYLKGYWEIDHVDKPDGTVQDFKMNMILDFIEIKDSTGTRTKVSPQLDGTFLTTGVTDVFSLKIEEDSLRIYYKTPYDSWKETVLRAEDSLLVIKNKDNKIYRYKKFRKFDFE